MPYAKFEQILRPKNRRFRAVLGGYSSQFEILSNFEPKALVLVHGAEGQGVPGRLPGAAYDLVLVPARSLCVGTCTASVDLTGSDSQTQHVVLATVTFAHPCGTEFDQLI